MRFLKAAHLFRRNKPSWYCHRLDRFTVSEIPPVSVVNIKKQNCLEHNHLRLFFGFVILWAGIASLPVRAQPTAPVKVNAPAADEILLEAVTQDSKDEWKYLRGSCKIETTESIVYADEIDYNTVTHWAIARGHVRMEHLASGDKLEADHGEYNLETSEGKFYVVSGTSPSKIQTRPGMLSTTNPFYFQGQWAERMKDRYVVHHGFVTDCKMPKVWWRLDSPKFDIIPDDRAIARHAIFKLKGVPLLYAPVVYRPLGENERQSGFLTPSLGTSSRRGQMVGFGYYWAINRSYDLTYRGQYFTARGPAHTVDFRGKPNQTTDFDFNLYGVNDSGYNPGGGPNTVKQGGYSINATAKTLLPGGFEGKLNYNYLSSFAFRQAFTESIRDASFSEVDATGYIQKHWSTFGFFGVYQRHDLFESVTKDDRVYVQKLPEFSFLSRSREIENSVIPLWFSFDTSLGLLRRQEPVYKNGTPVLDANETAIQTRVTANRQDMYPRVMTAFDWKGIRLIPSFAIRETHYGLLTSTSDSTGSRLLTDDQFPKRNLWRNAREFNLELVPPSLEKTFGAPKRLGQKFRHVIEPRASFKYVSGIDNFNQLVRFDEIDTMTNTNQAEVSLTNRLYLKKNNGEVQEIITWQVLQQRYFDPSFGGAVVEGQRNVIASSLDITPYAFLDGPRNYSPVVSSLRVSPFYIFGLEWRTDYDPKRSRFVDRTIAVDARWKNYFVSAGDTVVNSTPVLSPASARQLRLAFGAGNANRRGWNGATTVYYDYDQMKPQYIITNISYNTDCCGFSVQYNRFSFGTRNENQYRFALVIANIGSFGTLRKQDRIF